MKCRLCQKNNADTPSFITLFHPQPFCEECMARYQPHFHSEIIPYQNGMILYHSVYEIESVDPIANRLLFRYARAFFKYLEVASSWDRLVIWIDHDEFETLPKWFPVFASYAKMEWFSLFYFDFSIYDDLSFFS